MWADRFPARPYILEGYPLNKTAVVNGSVMFDCPTIADIAAHISWAKYLALNDTDSRPNTLRFEVHCVSYVFISGDGHFSWVVGFLDKNLNFCFEKFRRRVIVLVSKE